LARTSERPEGADALPPRELNPLMNPLLADHMGRWAEVYFTNPPERRDEAVLELVRELEREQSQANAAVPTAPPSPATLSGTAQTFSASRRQDTWLCDSCGNKNPVTHQFCGMCGAKVKADPPQAALHENAEGGNHRVPESTFTRAEADRPDTDRSQLDPVNTDPINLGPDNLGPVNLGPAVQDRSAEQFYAEPEELSPAPVFNAPAAGSDSLSLFQSFRSARAEDEDWDYEPQSSGHYRFYIAAVLLIIIGGLGYMAWRSSQSTPAFRGASPPPPAPVTESAEPGPASSPAAASPEQTAVPKNPQQTAAPAPKTETAASPRNVEPARTAIAKKASPSPSANEANQIEQGSAGGVQELAMAERYLNGSAGHGRDSGEAARWLWKSIAKHNGQATLLLADLYLRGDGVPKNCDQGRVLLDSAARSGVAGAGEQLRNLPAFGCR
jgi:hypothetical protein